MKKNFVPQKDIALVVDGLNKYFQRMVETHTFNPLEMKNLMEPIFTEAGYRRYDHENNLGGRMDSQINILLIHDSGVGDFVIKSPTIKEIRRLYPTAHITLVFFPRAAALAENCPYVDEVIPNGRECNWHSLLEIYRWNLGIAQRLLRRRLDIVYAFTQYPSTILLSYMSGAKERISHKFTPESGAIECGSFYIFSPLLTIEVPDQHYGTHSVDHDLNLLDYTLHAPVANRELEVWYTPSDITGATEFLQDDLTVGNKIIAVCMGGNSLKKQWQPENYARLVDKIIKLERNVKFVIIGGGAMDEQSATVFKQSIDQKNIDRFIDLTNKIDYRKSAAVLSLCDMYIGNDTGTMHIAAALKIPVLSPNCFAADLPFEHSIPRGYYPYRVPSITVMPKHALDECKNSTDGYGCINTDRHCITKITVDKMFDAYKQLKKRIAVNNIEPLFIN